MSYRTMQFEKELKELCKKFGCKIIIENHWVGWPECGSDNRIIVEFDSVYDSEKNLIDNSDDLDLGSYFDAE